MEGRPEVLGLPLAEARGRLAAQGIEVRVRRTGEVGPRRADRRRVEQGLVAGEERVLQVRGAGGEVELVVGVTYRRPRP